MCFVVVCVGCGVVLIGIGDVKVFDDEFSVGCVCVMWVYDDVEDDVGSVFCIVVIVVMFVVVNMLWVLVNVVDYLRVLMSIWLKYRRDGL